MSEETLASNKESLLSRLLSVMKLPKSSTATEINSSNPITTEIVARITEATNAKDIKAIGKNLDSLEKLDKVVTEVIDNLEKRRGIFKTNPTEKINSIKAAYENLSLHDRVLLATSGSTVLTGVDSDGHPNSKELETFLTQISAKRSNFSSKEATSFTEFKSSIRDLHESENKQNAKEEAVEKLFEPPTPRG